MENAREGLCNAGALARFIDYKILAQCILSGLAVAAVKGGYNEVMVSRERKRADAAEQRADEAEERLRQERKRVDELIEEFRAEIRAGQEARRTEQEARLAEQEARRTEQEARLAEQEANRVERQAMMEALAQMSNTIAQLLERQNGRSSPEDR